MSVLSSPPTIPSKPTLNEDWEFNWTSARTHNWLAGSPRNKQIGQGCLSEKNWIALWNDDYRWQNFPLCCRKRMLVVGWHNFWLGFLFIEKRSTYLVFSKLVSTGYTQSRPSRPWDSPCSVTRTYYSKTSEYTLLGQTGTLWNEPILLCQRAALVWMNQCTRNIHCLSCGLL